MNADANTIWNFGKKMITVGRTVFAYEVKDDDNGILSVDIYDLVTDEHLVGVYFDYDTEQAHIEGPEFREPSPFDMHVWQPHRIASWAIKFMYMIG